MLMQHGEQERSNLIFGPEGADMLRLDSVSCDSLPAYFGGLDQRLVRSGPVAAALTWAAVLMEPYDVALERTDPKELASKSFLRGSSLALQAAKKLLPLSAITHLGEFEIETEMSDDANEVTRRNEFGQLIMQLSEKGYNLASAYHGLLDEWIDELNPYISQQVNTKLGFGFVFFLIHNYYERTAREDMGALADLLDEGAIDWDEEFAELDSEE